MDLFRVVSQSQPAHPVSQSQRLRTLLQRRSARTLAGDEHDRRPALEPGDRLEQDVEALDAFEPSNRPNHPIAFRESKGAPHRFTDARNAPEIRRIDAVEDSPHAPGTGAERDQRASYGLR